MAKMSECITVGHGDEMRCNDCENEGILRRRGLMEDRVEIPILWNGAAATESGLQSPVLSFRTSVSIKSVIDFNRHWFSYQLSNPRMLTSLKLIPRCPARTLKVRVDWILKKTKTFHWSELNNLTHLEMSSIVLERSHFLIKSYKKSKFSWFDPNVEHVGSLVAVC